MYPIFLYYFLCSIFIFSGKIYAEQFKYEHATVKTKSGIEIKVEVADTSQKRSLGLGKRLGLEKEWGMLFVFKNRKKHSFWMKDMNFALDIVWLDNFRIIYIHRNVQPVKVGEKLIIIEPPEPANFVLEVAAGLSSELGLKKGDRLEYKFQNLKN